MSTAESRSRMLDPGPLITLYDLDLTSKGGPVIYFHDGIASSDVTFADGTINSGQPNVLHSAKANFVQTDRNLVINGDYLDPRTAIAGVASESSVTLTIPAVDVPAGNHGGLRFTIQKRRNNEIGWKGKVYTPFPIKAEQIEWSTSGALPRPTLSVSNIGSLVSALMRQYEDFIGCKIIRTRTFAAFIEGGAEEDFSQHFPGEIFQVERKSVESNTICSFELSMPIDAEGVLLPRRQVLAHVCTWLYRGADCQYAGSPITSRLGVPLGPTFVGNITGQVADGHSTLTITSPGQAFIATDVGKTVSSLGNFHPGTKIAVWGGAGNPGNVALDGWAIRNASNIHFTINRFVQRGAWATNAWYKQWDMAYIQGPVSRVYYVSLRDNNHSNPPDDITKQGVWWDTDVCLKTLDDCRWHFGANAVLRTSAFPGCYKVGQ